MAKSAFRITAIAAVSLLTTTVNAYCLPDNWSPPDTWSPVVRSPTPTLPLNEIASEKGASSFPTPTTSPVAITLGVGFQNYTCGPSGTYVQTLAADGALAELYDLADVLTQSNIDNVTVTALKVFEQCESSPTSNYWLCHFLAAESVKGLALPQHLGEHFFSPVNGVQTPHFALNALNRYLEAKKVAAAAAPPGSYAGENGLGAVPWLYLVSDGSSFTQGLTAVYRVETAGGVAPSSCSTAGDTLSVPYAAQYWFYD